MGPSQVVLYQANSQYDALSSWIPHLAKGFQSLGYDPIVVVLTDNSQIATLNAAFQRRKIKLVLGLNGWGIDISIRGQSAYDLLEIPYILWQFDHPFHGLKRLLSPLNQMVTAYVDETHLAFAREFIKVPCVKKFIPHAGTQVVKDIKPLSEREFPIVFMGSFVNLDDYREKLRSEDPIFNKAIWQTIEEAQFDWKTPLHQHYFNQLMSLGVEPEYLDLMSQFNVLAEIELFIRSVRRNRLIKAIKKTPIHIYTNNPEAFPLGASNVTLHDFVPYEEALHVYANSKLVLHNSPCIVSGGHDRIFGAQLQGAVSVSDKNQWLLDQYPAEASMLYYDLDVTDLDEYLLHWLNQPEDLQALSDKAYQNTSANHQWIHRAQALIDLADTHTFMQRAMPHPPEE